MAKMGRPKKIIDKNQFEQLCAMQCTEVEICAWFDVTDKTLTAWCRQEYKMTFSEVFEQKRKRGLISLRRAQFQLAEKNPTMAIWLGKQYLGQREKQEDEVKAEMEAMLKNIQTMNDIFTNPAEDRNIEDLE